MKPNRNQTVTKTEHLLGLLRKSLSFAQLEMRRAGIEPATYSFYEIVQRARFWFSPLKTRLSVVTSLLGKPKSRNRNRNATVIRVPSIYDAPLHFLVPIWRWIA